MLDISPNLYEAKINLEDSKGSALFEQNLKAYNQLVEQEAKANRVSSAEVVRYMDEAYNAVLEEETEAYYERMCPEAGFGAKDDGYMSWRKYVK